MNNVLNQYNCICLDSSPFIYFIEEYPRYVSIVEQIFQEITYGKLKGITSYLSLLEVLVKPIEKGDNKIASQYKNLMLSNPFLQLFPLDDKVAEAAANLRAKYKGNGFKLKTPDAIQIATGILNGAEVFLTNDKSLKQINEINVIALDDMLN